MNLLDIKPHKVAKGVLGKHFLIYGAPGTRKTTIASNFPRPLLLATEVGYSFIEGVRAVDISSWYEFKAVVEQLKKPEVRAEFDTVVIDTTSLLTNMAEKYITSKLGVAALGDAAWGKGWGDYRKELSETFNFIAQKGYGVVFIAHAKEVSQVDEESGLVRLASATPDIDNTGMKIVHAMTDFILYARKEENANGDPSVFAYANHPSPDIITKSRVRGVPARFEFTFENLEKAITNAVDDLNIEVTDEIEQKVSYNDTIDLETLKNSVQELAQQAMGLGLGAQVENIFRTALNGIPLSSVTETHKDSLMAVELAFKELIGG